MAIPAPAHLQLTVHHLGVCYNPRIGLKRLSLVMIMANSTIAGRD
jgi:hypothetical protein